MRSQRQPGEVSVLLLVHVIEVKYILVNISLKFFSLRNLLFRWCLLYLKLYFQNTFEVLFVQCF